MLQPGAKVLAHRSMYDQIQSRVVRALADGIFLRFEKRCDAQLRDSVWCCLIRRPLLVPVSDGEDYTSILWTVCA